MSEEKDKRTLEDRIKELMTKFKIEERKDEFLRLVIELVERGVNPQHFCPKCDYRMLYDPTLAVMKCINCGNFISSRDIILGANKLKFSAGKPLPAGVENLIKSEREVSKKKKVSMAEKVNKLRSAAAGETVNLNDEEIVRAQDPRIKGDIKWS